MSIYTINNESAVTPAYNDLTLLYDTSGSAIGQAQVNRLGGVPTVSITSATAALTAATHANRIVVMDATPCVLTLPQATGSGDTYTVVVKTAATGTQSKIQVANATDVMRGIVWAATTTSDNAEAFIATATSDTLTLNGTTTGGVVGDTYIIRDVYTGVFNVQGSTAPTGTEATPFSAAVA